MPGPGVAAGDLGARKRAGALGVVWRAAVRSWCSPRKVQGCVEEVFSFVGVVCNEKEK